MPTAAVLTAHRFGVSHRTRQCPRASPEALCGAEENGPAWGGLGGSFHDPARGRGVLGPILSRLQ
jgi:hypothetical protein